MEQLTFNFANICPRCGSSALMGEPHTNYDYTRCIEALRRDNKISSKGLQEWRKFAQEHTGQEFLDEFNRIVDEAIQNGAETAAERSAFEELFSEAAA